MYIYATIGFSDASKIPVILPLKEKSLFYKLSTLHGDCFPAGCVTVIILKFMSFMLHYSNSSKTFSTQVN